MEDEAWSIVDALQDALSSFLNTLGDALPKLIGFLLILFIGWFVAKFVARIVGRLFKAVNIDRYLDRAGIGGPLERAGYADSGRFVTKIMYYLMMLFVLKAAFGFLDIDALNQPFDALILWIPKALVALILIVIGGIVANVVRDLVAGITAGQSYSNMATNAAGLGVWMIFGLAALDQAQIAGDLIDTLTTTILASLGAILVIKYGVGGIWSARDRFWPKVYDSVGSATASGAPQQAPAPQPRV